MSYQAQPYRSSKRLAQLIKLESKSPLPQQKQVQQPTNIIQTRHAQPKIEPTPLTQNTRSKSNQKDANSSKMAQQPQLREQVPIKQLQKPMKQESVNPIKQQQNVRSASNLSQKQSAKQQQPTQISKTNVKQQQQEALSQSTKKRGFQESLIGAKSQQQPAYQSKKQQSEKSNENKKQTSKQNTQQVKIEKDIDLDDLLSSQKTVRRCTKDKVSKQIQDEKIDITNTYTQIEGRSKRQKTGILTESYSQMTTRQTRQSQASRSKTPIKQEQPMYYTQVTPSTTGRSTRSKSNLKESEKIDISSQTISIIKEALQNNSKTNQSKSKLQSVKLESDYELSQILQFQSNKTSQRCKVEQLQSQNTQKTNKKGNKTAAQTQNTNNFDLYNTQKSQHDKKSQKSTTNRSSSRQEQSQLTSTQYERQTRSTRSNNQLQITEQSQISHKTQQSNKQQIKQQNENRNVNDDEVRQTRNNKKQLDNSITKDILNSQDQNKQLRENKLDYYEPMTCSQLMEDITIMQTPKSKKDKINNHKEASFKPVTDFKIENEIQSQQKQNAADLYLDELILFSGIKDTKIQTVQQQQQQPIKQEVKEFQLQQKQEVIIQTQTDDDEPMEIDLCQYEADYSQVATVARNNQKYSVKDIKKNLINNRSWQQQQQQQQKQLQQMQQRIQQQQNVATNNVVINNKVNQNDLDIIKLERELDNFERKQKFQQVIPQQLAQALLIQQQQQLQQQNQIDMIKPRSITPNHTNNQFVVPQCNDIKKRTPTSIYNHAPIAFIKEENTNKIVSNQQQQMQRNNQIEEEKQQLNVNYNNNDIRTPQKQNAQQKQQQIQHQENTRQVFAMNLPSKNDLDAARRAYSNKPTPTPYYTFILNNLNNVNNNNQNSTNGGPMRYSSTSSKRINSDKPTPCLDRKLNELRNQANINGGVLLSNHINLNNLNNMSDTVSNIANNGTFSRYNFNNNNNTTTQHQLTTNEISFNNINTTTPSRMQGYDRSGTGTYNQFTLSNMQSETITPFKERFERATREEEILTQQRNMQQQEDIQMKEQTQNKEEIKQQNNIQQVTQQDKHILNPELLTQKLQEQQQNLALQNTQAKDTKRQSNSRDNKLKQQQQQQNNTVIDLTKDQDNDTIMKDDTKLPLKQHQQQVTLEQKTQQILNSIPMSEKYADLLTNNTKIINNQQQSNQKQKQNNNSKVLQLPLPAHYKQLLYMFNNLDQTINFLKIRKQALTFTNIQKAVQQQSRKNFNLANFAQILYVAPIMYTHKWEQKSKGYELLIEIPKNIKQLLNKQEKQINEEGYEEQLYSDLLEKRSVYFKNRLLSITYKHYLKCKEQQKDSEFFSDLIKLIDPIKDNQWPVFFDPHSVPEIPKITLKEQPKQSKSHTVSEFINITNINRHSALIPQSDNTQQNIQALQNQQQQQNQNNNEDKGANTNIQCTNQQQNELNVQTQQQVCKDSSPQKQIEQKDELQSVSTALTSRTANPYTQTSSRLLEAHLYLSQDLISKIKQKQQRVEYHKQLNQEYMERQDQQKYIESYTSIIRTINMQFMTRTTNTIQLKDLITVLDDKQRGKFNSKDLMIEQINKIAQILPDWISLFNSPMGGYHIKIKNRKTQVADLIVKVEQYLKDNMPQQILTSNINVNASNHIENGINQSQLI